MQRWVAMFDVKELDCIFMYRFAKQSVFTVILIPLPAGMILSLHILMLLKRKFQPIRTSSKDTG